MSALLAFSISSFRDPPIKQRRRAQSSGARWGNLLCTNVHASILRPSLRGIRKPKPGGNAARTPLSYPRLTVIDEVYAIPDSSDANCGLAACNRVELTCAGVATITASY